MANVQETDDLYPEGVYQFEMTDPVQGGTGGIDNLPSTQLANRTRWLRKRLESLGLTLNDKAPKDAPAFTGTPTAPTAPTGIDNQQIANAAFATALKHGIYRRDVTADGAAFSLTRDQASVGILLFTGTNADGKTVTIPSLTTTTRSRLWVVDNRTSGGGAITVNPTGGAGITVLNGRSTILYMDGAVIRRALTDYTDAYLQKCFGLTPASNATGEELVNARWVRQALAEASGFRTGDIKATMQYYEEGWVILWDGTIGNPTSGATARAAANCEALYKYLWANVPQTWCPVTGGRGASADADWQAGKVIQLPRFAGRVVGGNGGGAGLSGKQLGSYTGVERVTLLRTEMPFHDHGNLTTMNGNHGHIAWTDVQGRHTHTSFIGLDYGGTGAGNAVYGDEGKYGTTYLETSPEGAHAHNVGIQTGGEHQHAIPGDGSSASHENMQPSVFVNWMIKL